MEELPPVELSVLKEKIITDEIRVYNNHQDVEKILSELKKGTNKIIDELKDILYSFTDELIRVTGDPMISNGKLLIFTFIRTKCKDICNEIIKEWYDYNNGIYRERVVIGDDNFYLNHSLDQVDPNGTSIWLIFKFKDFWHKLNDQNRLIIKNTLLAVVSLIDVKYLNYKKYLCLKTLNPSYSKLFNSYEEYLL